jgi:cell division protein FtsQ
MRLIKYSIMVGLLAFGAFRLQAYLRVAEHFKIDTIEVRGAFFLPKAEIVRRAGLKRGENLFGFDPRVAEADLSSDPWVKKVRAQRLVPDRVVVSVDERKPVAMVVGQGLYCLALDGTLLPLRENAGRLALPVVRGIPVGPGMEGKIVDSFSLDNLLKHMAANDAPFRLSDLSEIRIEGSGYQLVTVNGIVVNTGMELKKSMSLLRRAMDDAALRGIEYRTADTRVEGQIILN